MGWLVTYTLASMAASFIVVKIFDYAFEGVHNGFISTARVGVFVLTWTVVTAKAGMHGFSRRVRQVRQGFVQRILH